MAKITDAELNVAYCEERANHYKLSSEKSMTERGCDNCNSLSLFFAVDGATVFDEKPLFAVACFNCKLVKTFEKDGKLSAYEVWNR